MKWHAQGVHLEHNVQGIFGVCTFDSRHEDVHASIALAFCHGRLLLHCLCTPIVDDVLFDALDDMFLIRSYAKLAISITGIIEVLDDCGYEPLWLPLSSSAVTPNCLG